MPWFEGAVVTPLSWVSSSLTPTLDIPGASGAWSFTLDDLSDGASGFGPLTYRESGPSARIPLDAGLQHGRVYAWTASSADGSQPEVGGAFQVDVQLAGVQEVDGAGGVTVGMASGEVGFSWASQAMTSPAGSVGFGLRYTPSNPPEVGVPAGWTLQAASSSQYRRIDISPDGGVGLVANNGIVTNYRPGADGVLEPVRLTGAIDAAGAAPVVIANGDGTYSVTTKEMVSVFAAADGEVA
jgi:hypothetical protein